MRHISAILFVVFLLGGCGYESEPIDMAMNLRESILTSNGISFDAVITADYEDALYVFELDCQEDHEGNLSFTIVQPKSISGITGIVTHDQQAITFDDKVLAFPPLSDGQLTPAIAPYLFLKALQSGYLSACGREGEGYCIYIDDSFQNNQMHLQVFTDADFLPVRAEIVYRNHRILSLDINNFTVL